MPNYIGDNVIPSVFGINSNGNFSDGGMSSNLVLRLGEVRRQLLPGDKGNVSKKFTEYDVLVGEKNNGTAASRLYSNCVVSSLFGGQGDTFVWTPRFDPSPTINKGDITGTGSKVLLLCLNGQTTNAIIIGAVRDDNDKTEVKYTKDQNPGHHLLWNFNGIEAAINDDGEIKVTYKGKTKNDGSLDADEDAVGTFIRLIKNGNLELSTPGEDQTFILNHDGKTIETKANEGWNVEVSNGRSTIKSDGLSIGAATDATLLGETHRIAQQALHTELMALLVAAATEIASIGFFISYAGAQASAAIVPNAIPVIGGILAIPFWGGMADGLNKAGYIVPTLSATITAMQTAITEFEATGAASTNFLSTRNLSD